MQILESNRPIMKCEHFVNLIVTSRSPSVHKQALGRLPSPQATRGCVCECECVRTRRGVPCQYMLCFGVGRTFVTIIASDFALSVPARSAANRTP